MKIYDYLIIGGGVCGCNVAYELYKHTQNVLLVDKLDDVAKGASGAAGAFLSPLLGKPNSFKDLVTASLSFSIDFYKQHTPQSIDNCGTIRIPKDTTDEEKFQSYIPFIDFPFEKKDSGYFFPIGSVVKSYEICKTLTKDIEKKLNYEVVSIEYDGINWIVNNEITTKNLILTTGANTKLLDEKYIDIRAVWGQRIDIETSTKTLVNYHKECSVSKSTPLDSTTNKLSIGATH
ncbi:MAG: FAD-binding oxidoreductase, partial [Epsilonproteobacteria bacterium]|nr:FAD-binding oxidoreductase [Campylobacterota bacterium]